jgi:hypothetical protein
MAVEEKGPGDAAAEVVAVDEVLGTLLELVVVIVVVFFLVVVVTAEAACRADFARPVVTVGPAVGTVNDDFPVFRCVSIACCFLRTLASSGSSFRLLSSSSTGSSSALDWSKSESTISSSSISSLKCQ